MNSPGETRDRPTYLRKTPIGPYGARGWCVSRLKLSVILSLLSFSLTGCGRAPHSENVKPGDADYPVDNPHPVDVIKLTVIIPAAIKVQLYQGYTTRGGGGSVESGPPCAYIQTGSQARIQYGIAPELELNRMEPDSFSGQVVLDRYLPGQCAWSFAGAWYSDDGASDQAELLVEREQVSHLANARLDLWCIRKPKRDPRIVQACLDIHALGQHFPEHVSAMPFKAIVRSGGGNEAPMAVGRGMKSLVIQFHDLDATTGDLGLRVN